MKHRHHALPRWPSPARIALAACAIGAAPLGLGVAFATGGGELESAWWISAAIATSLFAMFVAVWRRAPGARARSFVAVTVLVGAVWVAIASAAGGWILAPVARLAPIAWAASALAVIAAGLVVVEEGSWLAWIEDVQAGRRPGMRVVWRGEGGVVEREIVADEGYRASSVYVPAAHLPKTLGALKREARGHRAVALFTILFAIGSVAASALRTSHCAAPDVVASIYGGASYTRAERFTDVAIEGVTLWRVEARSRSAATACGPRIVGVTQDGELVEKKWLVRRLPSLPAEGVVDVLIATASDCPATTRVRGQSESEQRIVSFEVGTETHRVDLDTGEVERVQYVPPERALWSSLRDDEIRLEERISVLEALILHTPWSQSDLPSFAKLPRPELRRAALWALRKSPSFRTADLAERMLEGDDDPLVRVAAAKALVAIVGPKRAEPALRAAIARETSAVARDAMSRLSRAEVSYAGPTSQR